tara:strand:- start:160 stop:789 length:630 start_codon:yes stop_codon:yes gene_type:complete
MKNLQVKIISLDNKELESTMLPKNIFGLDIKEEIIAKVVNWQLAKKRQGSHKVKERNEIVGSNAKIYKQKGMGRARHGSKKVVQFKGGGVVHGPRLRSHEYKLQSKVKKQAMRFLLSSKLKDGKLKILDKFSVKKINTKDMVSKINKLGIKSATFIESKDIDKNFYLSTRNIKNIDVISFKGMNVYQVLKREELVITKEVLNNIEDQLG